MATLTPVVAESAQEIQQWRLRFDREVTKLLTPKGTLSDPLKEVGACNFFLAYQPEGNKHLQQIAAQLYAAACPDLLYSAPHCLQYAPKAKDDRLRIGFISKFMHNHSIGRTTRGLLANMDRSRFHVSALFVPPLVDDFVSQFVRDSADDYLVLPSTLQAARLEIAALKLDVLFYQDIGMDAYTYFLAFSRLAPVQCVSFGHPDTTGIPNMDYWVSSENFELPSAADHYSEELFLLHNLGSLAYYYRPTLQPTTKTREDFGLPTDRHLYICPQALFKLHPDFDAIIAGILRGDPLGEVVLVEARTTAWNEQLRKRFQVTIPDVVGQVRFVPGLSQDDFLSLIAVCDVMLDTIYFNGMNTSLEALAVGTPVVTMPTTLQRGRHTFGMYARMGMTECIAATPQKYISLAQRLGTDTVFRQQVKDQILSRNDVLYEDMNVVREFERCFETAHQRLIGDKNVTA
jgi:predicted O-linked N-acetylglucosamine transferase (SPINDLY family)